MPGAWTMQGFPDRPHYTNVQMPFEGLPAHLPEHQPTGVYERTFELPDGWRGRRIVLHVGAAESVLIARLNDREVGISKDSHLAAEFDVTELVQPGENTLSLRVVKWSDATYVEDQDQWWHGGITRSVFLYATGPVHLADVRADAGLADDLTTGTLELTATLGFPGDELGARLGRRGAAGGRRRAARRRSPGRRPAGGDGLDPGRPAPPVRSRGRPAHVGGGGRRLGGAPSADGSAARRPGHLAVWSCRTWPAGPPRSRTSTT